MYDLREHKELISQLVSEANQNDETLMVHAIRNTAHACY